MVPIKSHQHISIRGDKQTITEDFKPVHKRTRAGNNGKNIMCPRCGHIHRVNNFSWQELQCPKCTLWVTKYEWLVDQLDTWKTPR